MRVNQKASQEQAPVLEEQSNTTRTLTCSNVDETVVYRAHGSQIYSSSQTFFLSYEDLHLDAGADEQTALSQAQSAYQKAFGTVDGLTVSTNAVNGGVEVSIQVNYERADLSQLARLGLISEAEIANEYVSLPKTQKELTSAGYACSVETVN